MISVGTTESNDCLISVKKHKKLEIFFINEEENPYANHIKKLINDYCLDNNHSNVFIEINDKGALDFCILARLKTALERLEK
ncbi:citrate lyase acyl carrier protein [Campylobacter canadensis]|uniref:Citrate lyase acyl carrier protein n=1 Tax=Campylobacter canadensis TaxID=449520 RepID=A0ABS7WS49_9BACT|nr:citrate lyase acyl carrier protein [Campylobacter canadensis]MBZ7986899.1 citrate lyase acyl carrier protein [Campylobacter canadensis]MBZ7994221.1 citrate lyase acyl carrier protein [Campylobacter canadensis]MBZ7995787.1 citrate lyase acyl carrier protein [Campylobacter canadensis]MBZ7997936.1 citrate lyase acyl carrier protein [Campylobacter canadensis]MBZ7999553.1 citrate lyase acyl carrier protein [Campylobacter canadensis]